MRFFSKIQYLKTSSKNYHETRRLLDDLLKNSKYEGYWKDDCLYISKIVIMNYIMPIITIKVFPDTTLNISKISVEIEVKYSFQLLMWIIVILMILLEFLIVRDLIINKTFNLSFLVPILMGSFIYFIIYARNKWGSDSFKYDLNKLIK